MRHSTSATEATLVIVPALGGSRAMLEPFLRELPRWVERHVLEPPGFGDVSAPKGIPSTRRLARAAASQWPAGADASATYLFGISLGGMVAQWLALDHGRIAGLILASTTHRGLVALGSPVQAMALARNLLEPGEDAHAQLVEDVVERPSAARQAREAAEAHPRDTADLAWLASASVAHSAPVEELTVPTVVLTGRDDPLMDPSAQEELAERLNALEHLVFDGLGHDLTLDAPQRCAEAVGAAITTMREA